MQEGSQNQIEAVMSTALKNIKSIADVNTVIGAPFIHPDGTAIIPVSKVTVGVLTGGGEYAGSKELAKRAQDYPFSGGSGAAISLNPIGFLVQSGNDIKMVNVQQAGAYEKLFDAAGSVLSKFIKPN